MQSSTSSTPETGSEKDHENARAESRAAFLKAAGWAAADAEPLTADASTRTYERLRLGDRQALLMSAPPGAETTSCPPDATLQERQSLGYNALARLAGPNLHAFVDISAALRRAGLSAPDIYAADTQTGFAVIEDLGDALYARAIPDGADEKLLYSAAIDALVALRRSGVTAPSADHYVMLDYDRVAMNAEVALLSEWYWPHRNGAAISPELASDYAASWAGALERLSQPHTIVLRDFHAENLLWLPSRKGVARAGVIDFQDGLFGHAAYDLVSLLEDARRDVDPALAQAMIAHYCRQAKDAPDFDKERLLSDYAILGAQRNAKILGIFARLITRDHKPRYAQFFSRVENHFRNDLKHPSLADVRSFFSRHMPDLAPHD